MPHQLSTAIGGAGETYDTATGSGFHRQVIVVSTSGVLPPPSSSWTLGASTEYTGAISSGSKFIGSVSLSSGLGGSTAVIGSLSSGLSFLGVIGITSGTVGLSSDVTLSSGTRTIGGLAASTAIIGSLSSGLAFLGAVGISSGTVGLSSAVTLSSGSAYLGVVVSATSGIVNLSSGTLQLGAVGISSGTVGLSSAVTLSSGVTYIGTVASASSGLVGIVTNISTGATVLLSTPSLVGLSSVANLIASQTTAGAIASSALWVGAGAVATTAATPAFQSSGAAQAFMVDRAGALTVNLEGPRGFVQTANVVTVANTCYQQFIATPGANLVADIVSLQIFSTGTGSTTIQFGIVTLVSSSGQAVPGRWQIPWHYWLSNSTLGDAPFFASFPVPLTQLTANNAWGIQSTGAPLNIWAQYVVGAS